MAVVRKTFTGTLSASPSLTTSYQNYCITGLTSETSTTILGYMNSEASLHFLNALYQTLIEAGYEDVIKNETDYSITVLEFKFFVFVSGTNTIYPCIYTNGTANAFSNSFSGCQINENVSPYTKLEYNITVRGDSNHVSIYYGSYPNPATDIRLLSIAKGKNLITSSDIYLFGKSISSTNDNSGYALMREKDDLYNCFYNKNATPLDLYTTTSKGLNTSSKFVCVPQLAYYNTCLIYSMIHGNNTVFTSEKYYKIENEIYYNESGYLYKVG